MTQSEKIEKLADLFRRRDGIDADISAVIAEKPDGGGKTESPNKRKKLKSVGALYENGAWNCCGAKAPSRHLTSCGKGGKEAKGKLPPEHRFECTECKDRTDSDVKPFKCVCGSSTFVQIA